MTMYEQAPPPIQTLAPLRVRQRGISLFVVIVIVLLSTLLSLWAARTSLFNELIVGNDADYQRAFEAAQALMQDAELDIRGVKPDGSACTPVVAKPSICRVPDAATLVWYPEEDQDLATLFATLDAQPTKCLNGICLKRTGNQDFWTDATTLNAMIANNVGARYGEFTGAETGVVGSKASHSILKNTAAGQGGWYWVEVMPYDATAGNTGLISNGSSNLALNLKPNVAFRITTIARGLRPGTQVVLQSTFARQKLKN